MNHSLLACSLLACSDDQAGTYTWLEPGALAQVLCLHVCVEASQLVRARRGLCQHQPSSPSSTCLIIIIIIMIIMIIIVIIIIIISSSNSYSSSSSRSGLWSAAAGKCWRRCSGSSRAARCRASR